jgi:hypothetical protein
MKSEEYREYLRGRAVPDDAIEKRLAIVEEFAEFLAGLGLEENMAAAGKEEVGKFARKLITEGSNIS